MLVIFHDFFYSNEKNVSGSEVREHNFVHQMNIDDTNAYSELEFGVDYAGKNNGYVKFAMKNDLNLKITEVHWGKDSEMIVSVDFA